MNALSWLGNVSVGLLAAIAWDASPWGLALVAVPLGLLYLAYRGWLAQTVENELMEDIAHAADEITRDGNLAMRLPMRDAAPRLAALTVTLNRMLERLEGSFLRQRHFMRDAAEELREPVAALRRRDRARPATSRTCAPRSSASRASSTTWRRSPAPTRPGFIRPRPTAIAPVHRGGRHHREPDARRAALGDACRRPDCRPTSIPDRMRQVLLNLLQNAAEHGDHDGTRRPARRRRARRVAVRGLRRGRRRAGRATRTPSSSRSTARRRAAPDRAWAWRSSAPWPARTAARPGIVNRPGRGVTFWVRVPG